MHNLTAKNAASSWDVMEGICRMHRQRKIKEKTRGRKKKHGSVKYL